jgi:hypothetical protein
MSLRASSPDKEFDVQSLAPDLVGITKGEATPTLFDKEGLWEDLCDKTPQPTR